MTATATTRPTTTYLAPTSDARDVALAELGLAAPDTADDVRVLRLDTFDGRLHAAGVELLASRRGARGPWSVRILERRSPPVDVALRSVPRTAADLPEGPLRARIAGLLDVRVLLPMVAVRSRQRPIPVVDEEGKTVVALTVHADTTVVEPAGVEAPTTHAIEVVELTGYADAAERVRGVLDAHGLARHAGDLSRVVAELAGIDLAGHSSSPSARLRRRGPALEGVRAVLADLAGTIEANLPGTIDDLDPEFLHELRVAVRRTRSVVGHARRVLPDDVRDQARAGFKRIGTLTSEPRDLDVQVLEWDDAVADLDADTVAALDPVRDLLVRRRAAAHRELSHALRRRENRDLLDWWRTVLADGDMDGSGDDADRPLGEVLAARIERAQRRLLRHGRAIDDTSPAEELHELRKDAKKLRYLFECFADVLPRGPRKRFVKRLKTFQDLLGEHQDAEVHAHQLRVLADELHGEGAPAATVVAVGRLVELQEQRRAARRAEFAARFADYDSDDTHDALGAVLRKLRR